MVSRVHSDPSLYGFVNTLDKADILFAFNLHEVRQVESNRIDVCNSHLDSIDVYSITCDNSKS